MIAPVTHNQPTSSDAPPLNILTLPEVAQLLRVPEVAVVQSAAGGCIPGRLIGGEWRFDEYAITLWMRERETDSPSGKLRAWIASQSPKVWDDVAERECQEELALMAEIRKSWNDPVNPKLATQ